jgi:SAM-dependent methyltransferase
MEPFDSINPIYRCPECLAPLTARPGALRCEGCSRQYLVLDGLPLLCRDPSTYYGEISRTSMRRIVERARAIGCRQALLEHGDETGDMGFMRYALGEDRAAFRFLLPGFGCARLLDYGCGPGAVAIPLARSFRAVYATDLTPERAAFTQIRAHQEGLENVSVFCSGDTPHIPLEDGAADVAILNGVLEWLPEYCKGDPRTIQLRFLREIRRVLSSNAFLFIGIENRIGFGYFLGSPEQHTHLRFGSLLPRWAATAYSLAARGKPFRPRTYSRWGYRSLLNEAGFSAVDFWGLLPDYRETRKAVHLSDRRMIRASVVANGWRRRVRNAAIRVLLPTMCESFGILAGDAEPFLVGVVRHASELCKENLQLSRYGVAGSGAVHLHLSGTREYILKLPVSASTERRLAAGAENIRTIHSYVPDAPVAQPSMWSRYKGQPFLMEPALPGSAATNPEVGAPFLIQLARSTRKPAGAWRVSLSEVARSYAGQFVMEFQARGLRCCQPEEYVDPLLGGLSRVQGSGGFYCAVHGDFWSANVLTQGGQLTGILDADRFEPQSLPFLDLIHFLVRERDEFGRSVIELSNGAPVSVRRYAESIGVDTGLFRHFLTVYCLRQAIFLLREDAPQTQRTLHDTICRPLRHLSELCLLHLG